MLLASANHAVAETTCEQLRTLFELDEFEGRTNADLALSMYASGVSFGLSLAKLRIDNLATLVKEKGANPDHAATLVFAGEDIAGLQFSPLNNGEFGGRIAAMCREPANASKGLVEITMKLIGELQKARLADRPSPAP